MNKDKQNRITKFDELFERYYNAMLGAALRILKNERDAEDAVQQAGEALYKNIGKIPEVGDKGCYSFVILTVERKALNILKARNRRRETPLEDITEKGVELSAYDQDGALTQAIKGLPPRERQAILLRFGMGYSVKETAKIMEMSYSATQSLLWRAKGQLEKILSEKGEL
ncbi:MAG: sigma-70 family RNA polymerase sigma factor [Clostridia bacterium]|nr:sigma-70 family RNA polymerase sigma factor [Clostridia bacterium]MBR3865439.1 sigma-70 family RNA polymerase sigma factor [Clostridia bacterium]